MKREKRYSGRVLALYEAGPKGKLEVRAAKADQPAEILLYDEIGYWGVTASDFTAALASVGDQPVRVRINSPGGDVFDGLAMYNALLAHKPGVETVVDGLAASMASVIALAGKLTMQSASMYMIHKAWTITGGNEHDLAQVGGVLAKIDGQLAAVYAARTGKPVDEIVGAMAAETWYTADEAKAAGFAETVIAPPAAEPPKDDKRKARALARLLLTEAELPSQ
ncbi:head maturation protease, ClpP-related [Roseomonas sp. USHLN139]|uniref:head maturation protease, ClpP-related n=1 Tax=Roseomonas sp. USHLN139 TaxID=3081298 RepID=UPI003B022701